MLEIDGSMGEGGGQVLRTALSLSSVLGKAVRVRNIRAGRGQPGLKPQHLAACNALAEISGAALSGAKIGSSEVSFEPGEAKGGQLEIDIGTAGSCALLLQAMLPALLHAKEEGRVVLRGGTHVMHAPTFEYIANVFIPAIRGMGADASVEMKRAGFYPAGGGEMALSCKPSHLSGKEFKRIAGRKRREAEGFGSCAPVLESDVGYSIISSKLPLHVAKREEEAVLAAFPSAKGSAGEIPADCAGNAVTLWSGFFGESCLGKPGKKAEEVAGEACRGLVREMGTGAAVDSRLADQLLLYAACAKGKTKFTTPEFSEHLKTNALVVQAMTGRNIMLDPEGNSVEVV